MSDAKTDSDDSHMILDHVFRHHYGRLVSLLTRLFGVQHLEAVEDAVQLALQKACQVWQASGQPEDPQAWLYRVARNALIDHLRREKRQARFVDLQTSTIPTEQEWGTPEEFGDQTLRLLYLCCHPQIPLPSQVAFALKSVCGFSTPEIARALLIQPENVQKRIERAREKLSQFQLELESLRHPWMRQRTSSVLTVIYLIFNEGYLTTCNDHAIQQGLCQEGLRLARLLVENPLGQTGDTFALLALMCFHAARLPARTSEQGEMVLLENQDRRQWDSRLIAEGMHWMGHMAIDQSAGRYHLEAAIAWEHTRARNLQSTNWPRLVQIYRSLCRLVAGPAQILNLAIAESRAFGPQAGLSRLQQFPRERLPRPYPLWDAVLGELLAQLGRNEEARQHLQQAEAETSNPAEQRLLQEKIRNLPLNNRSGT